MLLVLFLVRPWRPIGPYLRYQKSAFITLWSAIYVQVVCLCLLWAIRFVVIVIQAVDKPSGVVTKPFDFYALATDSKPAIYTIISGVSIRCANSVRWIFTGFTTCAAMTDIGLSFFSDASSLLSLRWPSSHFRTQTSCLNLFKRQVRRLRKYIRHQRLEKALMMRIGVSLL
jgi:hypothetical protein